MSDLEKAILGLLKEGAPRRRGDELWHLASKRLQRPIPPDLYQSSLNSLQSQGLVSVRRGATETVSLISAEPPRSVEEPPYDAADSVVREKQLMPALDAWLRNEFAVRIAVGAQTIVRDTSRGSHLGPWSQPDFSIARVRTFKFSSAREVDLYGFELKPADKTNVSGIYEALAHRRWVHFAYLVLHVPNADDVAGELDVLRRECARHRIGFISFVKPDDWGTWREEIAADRGAPDPAFVDEFIQTKFCLADQELLKTWLCS